MEISFDPVKRAETLRERGLDFADAARLFEGPEVTFEDTRFDYPEARFATYGLLDDRLVAVIWTETALGRRIISMRKANGREQARYGKRLG
jgi:uncharacterized DUF497 family protein